MTTERQRAIWRKAQAKYRASGKQDDVTRRYRQTEKGRAMVGRVNAKRLWIGQRYIGRCGDETQADAINTHAKGRLSELRASQRVEVGG